jgi:hypothetical protein
MGVDPDVNLRRPASTPRLTPPCVVCVNCVDRRPASTCALYGDGGWARVTCRRRQATRQPWGWWPNNVCVDTAIVYCRWLRSFDRMWLASAWRRPLDRRRAGASTRRRPASTTQVDAVDAYHTWLASICVGHALNALNRLRQNGVNSDVKQRQIGVKGVKSGLCIEHT